MQMQKPFAFTLSFIIHSIPSHPISEPLNSSWVCMYPTSLPLKENHFLNLGWKKSYRMPASFVLVPACIPTYFSGNSYPVEQKVMVMVLAIGFSMSNID